MPKQKRVSNDTEVHLGILGIKPTGFERFESAEVLIEGLKGQDYRWRLTFKKTRRVVNLSSLVEAVGILRKPEPAADGK